MEPKKVKRAIIITVVAALILILLCLCLFFDWIKIPSKSTEQPEEPTVSEEPQPPSEEPQSPGEEPQPEPEKTPGPEDLSGCSDKLYYPKAESYLDSYESMVVRPSSGDTVYLQYRPEKIQYTTDAIMKLKANTTVTALAKENGYTLVLVQEGVAGWIRTFELDVH